MTGNSKLRNVAIGLAAAASFAWSAPALAGGAYCSPNWQPENPDLACASQIAISPGNDSRINLFLLVQDRAGKNGAGLAYPDLGWEGFYGKNFLRWQFVRDAFYPPVERTEWPDHYGSRCQTMESGRAAFSGVLAKRPAISSELKNFLEKSRSRVDAVCNEGPAALSLQRPGGYFSGSNDMGGMASDAGSMLSYLEGATSFYAGDWDRASSIYAQLAAESGDEWVKETALYMAARTSLNEAIENGEDKWGFFDAKEITGPAAKRSEAQLRTYLKTYPEGRYAASAYGLIRKALWLQRDYKRLAPLYDEMLNSVDASSEDAATLIEEIDDKLLIVSGSDVLNDAMLIAADDLMRMRSWNNDPEQQDFGAEPLSAEELEAQASVFADHPELFNFLKANHAFYVTKDYRLVRDLLPDDARQESYTPLAFSRQYLRGLALHALKDRNEAGFWLELIKGSTGIWQRPAVELALARNWEQAGKLDKVFAEDSPIEDLRIRRMLLGNSAGPDILKAQVRAEHRPATERSFALFTVLLKQLQYGEYAGFLKDYTFASQYRGGEDGGLWNIIDNEMPPVELFTNGKWSDGYPCPSLEKTARTLSASPNDVKARLCLGDFYRLNGFDEFVFGDRYAEPSDTPSLGERNYYPGTQLQRHDIYTSIMANRSASADDRAYALARAIRCYAPANYNGCGGPGVEQGQRAAWFRQLKRDYPRSKWAQELEYYW